MEKLKELFTNSKFSLGAACGLLMGYLMGFGSDSAGGMIPAVIVGVLILTIGENMISRQVTKKKSKK